MDSIYQLTFFLSLALLAIVITVFVLAVSLLGRAVKLSTEEQIEAEEKRKKDTENEIKEMQDKLDEARTEGHVDAGGFRRSLKALERKDARHKWKLRWIKIKPKFLTANWGALIPGALFLIAAILSGLALNQTGSTATASLYMWISLIALGIGICFVCLTLKVIQGVAITSEETAFVRQKEMLKSALIESEEERRPDLDFAFSGSQPPFHMKAGSKMVIEFTIEVIRGDVARKPSVFFHAPKGFLFPGSPTALPLLGIKWADYVSSYVDFEDTAIGIYRRGTITIKAPPKPDDYPLLHQCFSEGHHGKICEFHVIVE